MIWRVIESEQIFKQPWLNVRKDVCELPNGNKHSSYYILEYPNWVSAFAITEDNKVLLVRQYRHGLEVVSTELPGGVVDKGETEADAIARELKEETGYEFSSFEHLGKIAPNPATSNNYMHMYLARGGKKVAQQNLDETEDVEVLTCTIDEVKQLLKDHKIVQALHVTCMFYALEKLGELKY